MSTVVTLTHFLRGKVEVTPVLIDGRREWICPDRPMMRPWPGCYFNEPLHEVNALHVANSNQFPRAKEGVFGQAADRLSA